MMSELGKAIGAPVGSNQEQIAEFRNKIYKEDPKAYIQKLLKSTGINTMLVDTGFPHEEFTGYSVDLKVFSDLVGCRTYPIFRYDTSVFKVFKQMPPTFEEAIDIVQKGYRKSNQCGQSNCLKINHCL